MTDYVPIDCDQHSVLELLAMRRVPVTLEGVDEQGEACRLQGVVCDVVTRDGGEYLVLACADRRVSTRLDRISVLLGGHDDVLWCQKNGNHD